MILKWGEKELFRGAICNRGGGPIRSVGIKKSSLGGETGGKEDKKNQLCRVLPGKGGGGVKTRRIRGNATGGRKSCHIGGGER